MDANREVSIGVSLTQVEKIRDPVTDVPTESAALVLLVDGQLQGP